MSDENEHQDDMAVGPYEDLTNEDVMSGEELAEYDRDAELRLDAEQEARDAEAAAQDQAAEAGDPDDDEETFRDCGGYSPDTWCGSCEECLAQQAEERELYGEYA